MGRVADLTNKLPHGRLTAAEHHELAALLDSLMSNMGKFSPWSMPGSGIVREGPGIDITGNNRIGVGLDSILLADNTADTAAREYLPTSAGFDAALSAATAGDVLFLPARSISGNHTITAGVNVVGYSRYATKLTGVITMGGDAASIENLTVYYNVSSGSTIAALINPSSGTAYAHSCDIKVNNSGAGSAHAISLDNAGILEVWNSLTYATSTGASGYACYDNGGGGSVIFFGGRNYGSTDEYG